MPVSKSSRSFKKSVEDKGMSLGDILAGALNKTEPKEKSSRSSKVKPAKYTFSPEQMEMMTKLYEEKGIHYYTKDEDISSGYLNSPSNKWFTNLTHTPRNYGVATTYGYSHKLPVVWKKSVRYYSGDYGNILVTMSPEEVRMAIKNRIATQFIPCDRYGILDSKYFSEISNHSNQQHQHVPTCGIMIVYNEYEETATYHLNFDVKVVKDDLANDCIVVDVKGWVTAQDLIAYLEDFLSQVIWRGSWSRFDENFRIQVNNARFINAPERAFKAFKINRDTNDYMFAEGVLKLYGINRVVISQTAYRSYSEFQAVYPALTEEEFLTQWINGLQSSTVKLVDKHTKTLRRLECELLETQQKLTEQKRMMTLINTGFHSLYKGTQEKLKQVNEVESVELINGAFVLKTGDLYHELNSLDFGAMQDRCKSGEITEEPMTEFKKAGRVYVGRFAIFIDVLSNSAWVINYAMHEQNRVHAHGMGGGLCLGGWRNMMQSALADTDLPLLAEVIIEMLKNCDEDGRYNLGDFKTYPPETANWVRSKSSLLFGHVDIATVYQAFPPLVSPTQKKAKETGEYILDLKLMSEVDGQSLGQRDPDYDSTTGNRHEDDDGDDEEDDTEYEDEEEDDD